MRTITRAIALALVASAGLTGCETEGRSIIGTLTGREITVDIPEAAAAASDSEQTVGWDRIVVGVRPHNRTVGYLETRVFMPAGTHEVLQISYIWPKTLDDPWGFITANGGTYRFRIDGTSDSDFLGRLPVGTACLNVLGVCPKCAHRIPREVLHNIARSDLGSEYTADFRLHNVHHHKRSRDLHPSQSTGLHKHRGGGVTLDHACEDCDAARVEPLTGGHGSLRVQFEELTAADLASKPAAAPAPAPAPDPDDEG